jgi:hypothetical protein
MENVRKDPVDQGDANLQDNSISFLFEELSQSTRKMTPTQLWNSEINLYQSLSRPDGKTDPLLWWKCNLHQLPNLGIPTFDLFSSFFYLFSIFFRLLFILASIHYSGELARKYLGIPASQASCERLFSISKNDITETRTSMLPDLSEALLMIRKKKDILNLLSG